MTERNFTSPGRVVPWAIVGTSHFDGGHQVVFLPQELAHLRVHAETWHAAKLLAIAKLAEHGVMTDSPVLLMEDK